MGVFGWLNRLLMFLIVAAIVAAAALKYVPLVRTNIRLVAREQELRDSIAQKRAEAARLNARVRQLRDNPRAVEREARAQLGLARADEMVLWISPFIAKASPTNRMESPASAGQRLH
ncbi:MAG: FtsB family cell division protein [Verrucomicrobiota bacterium]